MHRIKIADPFIEGAFFDVDPEAIIERCRALWENRDKDHSLCHHCQQLRDRVEMEVENVSLLTALGQDPADVAMALEFSEVARPWGEPLVGPCDTQPYRPVDPNDSPPDETLPPALEGATKEELELAADGAAYEEVGFEVDG